MTPATQSWLCLEDVGFTYGTDRVPVLHHINATFRGGERIGLVGTNGSGKTTLLMLLSGIRQPTSGRIRLDDAAPSAEHNRIAVISADFDGFDYLTLEQNVEFCLEFAGAAHRQSVIRDEMERYGLTPHRRTRASEASRGMRRKTQLVIALLMQPRLLLADEPLDGLDEESQARWLEDLERIARAGAITITALHDTALVRAHSERVVQIDAGMLTDVT
ncbi:MAG: ABC transporter ATP-binding protein [bacterium]